MSLPRCPSCQSYSIQPDGGVNRCLSCQYSGPVAMFHNDDAPRSFVRGRKEAPTYQAGHIWFDGSGNKHVASARRKINVETSPRYWWQDS